MSILVNAPTGMQELIDLGEGGGYFEPDRVIWDTRKDGPMPAITLGGMKRVGADLVFDQALLDAHNAAQRGPNIAARWEDIKAERDRRQGTGVKVAGSWFHTDVDSRIKYIGLVIAGAGIPASLQWKTMSGAFVPMTQALAGQIFAAVIAYDTAVFANAESHRVTMAAAPDPLAYDISAGWPLTFGEAP